MTIFLRGWCIRHHPLLLRLYNGWAVDLLDGNFPTWPSQRWHDREHSVEVVYAAQPRKSGLSC